MIILINGSFAVGKTTAAELLVQHLYHSMLYDPEIVGAGLAGVHWGGGLATGVGTSYC